jgi:hypothetical protein
LLETFEAAVGDIVVHGERIGNADAREGQALLLLQIRYFVDHTDAAGMLAAFDKAGVEQCRHVAFLDVRIADTAFGRCHFNERFEP